ncbi:MAG: PEP-CTERM sorting domain-containing protein [Phycisphaerales bacterium]|nr:PEP-CTERM sorting domain-containing protein [Planctomycetota bacterium]
MSKSIFALALVAGAGICASSNAALVAYWNFNGSTTANGTTNTGGNGTLNTTAPDLGAATMSFSSGLTFNTTTTTTPTGNIGSFGGSTINALNSDPSGGALDITGAPDNKSASAVTANGQYIQFQFSMLGKANASFSWAGRGTSTGFGSAGTPNKLQYSVDGTNFQLLNTYTSTQTSFQLYSYSFGSALDGLANAYIRIVIDGATGGAGNNRWDNIQINADAVPAPGSIALVGLAGLVAGRRRRN